MILILDDDQALCDALQMTLEVAGSESVVAHTMYGTSFLSDIKQAKLLLLDITMPVKNGIDVLREVLELRPKLPVIMHTGTNEVDIAVRCLKMGAVDYLTKAATSDRIIAALEEHLPSSAPSENLSKDGFLAQIAMRKERLRHKETPLATTLYTALCVRREFCNPCLTLPNIAQQVDSPTRAVSQLITDSCGTDYRTFIRELRLELFIQKRATFDGHSLEGVAREVGFRRYATLCDVSRDILGVVPSEL